MSTEKATIRALNDALRHSLRTGVIALPNRTLMTPGVDALSKAQQLQAMHLVADFEDFTKDNDPHGEHDYGHVTLGDQKIIWKIDYYTLDMQHGSEAPSDATKTARVLSLMMDYEY